MIVIEFLIFVISSGLFFNERFRSNIYAWVTAGIIATASSLLFVYHLGAMFTVQAAEPPAVLKQVVRVPVVQKISQPPSLSKSQDCNEHYPFWAWLLNQEGTTELAFNVRADGTVENVSVTKSSGYEGLDDGAAKCVKAWHYQPAIKDGKLADAPWTTQVVWSLDEKAKPEDEK